MERIGSRRRPDGNLPRLTRADSVTPGRARRKEARELAYLAKRGTGSVPKTVGSDYEPEHIASLASCSVEVRYTAGVDIRYGCRRMVGAIPIRFAPS